MMNSHEYEYMTNLQYEVRLLRAQVEAFKNGKRYLDMEAEYGRQLRERDNEIARLKKELADSRLETKRVRRYWMEVNEDVVAEMEAAVKRLEGCLKAMEERALRAERQRDAALEENTERQRDIRRLSAELEEERGKNLKLTAQLNRDYENSSLPSSLSIRRRKIANSREKTGRKPGGQPGHKGHGRRKQAPTAEPVVLPPPQEVLEDPDFKKTGKTIVKQLVNIRLLLDVKEYRADVYYNSKTGERLHGRFPDGVVDDVNYGGSIRAFLFLLNNDCCTSIDRSRKFLSDLTGGKLEISKGMVSGLCRDFAERTEAERREAFADMLLSPVLHTDFTNARADGENVNVAVCAVPGGPALYFAREKKGHEGVQGTPVEDYQGILVHDHDRTYYHYGTGHQECLAHVLRYLKDSMANEPERTWNREMHSLLQKMIHYRNGLAPGEECKEEEVSRIEEEYRGILRKAKEEYGRIPASAYYKDGYNLYIRMEKYMAEHLLFLHDRRVPATNNEAERLLRKYKRKQKQAVTFRSFENINHLCGCMSMLVMMRQKEENLFDRVSEIFEEKTDGS